MLYRFKKSFIDAKVNKTKGNQKLEFKKSQISTPLIAATPALDSLVIQECQHHRSLRAGNIHQLKATAPTQHGGHFATTSTSQILSLSLKSAVSGEESTDEVILTSISGTLLPWIFHQASSWSRSHLPFLGHTLHVSEQCLEKLDVTDWRSYGSSSQLGGDRTQPQEKTGRERTVGDTDRQEQLRPVDWMKESCSRCEE